MLDNPLLGTTIGLIFFFLLLSLATTTLQELIATWLNLRGRNLFMALSELIRNPVDRKSFFEQPQIFSLFGGDLKETRPLQWMGDLFATIVALRSLWSTGPRPSRMPAYLDASSFAKAVLNAQPSQGANLPAKTAVADGAAVALVGMLRAANKDEPSIEKELEALFTATTERVSGWYKRQSQWISLLLGLGLALGANADTIHVARRLWDSPVLRAETTKAAEGFLAANRATVEKACAPVDGQGGPPADQAACDKAYGDLKVKLDSVVSAGYPIGWTDNQFWNFQTGQDPVSGMLGIILTALAVSLGNNFWFDLLSKFIRFRGTGKKEDAK